MASFHLVLKLKLLQFPLSKYIKHLLISWRKWNRKWSQQVRCAHRTQTVPIFILVNINLNCWPPWCINNLAMSHGFRHKDKHGTNPTRPFDPSRIQLNNFHRWP